MAITAKFTGIEREMKRLRTGVSKEVIRPANTAMRRATMAALRSYFISSPVWSGELVRNYRVAIGRTPTGFSNPVGGAYTWDGPANAQSDPGSATLGEDARRGPNEAAAMAEAKGVLAATNQGKTLTQTIWIKNTVNMDKAAKAQAGALPTPEKSRYPGGLNEKATLAALGASGGKLK